jgi:hypothetical protein
MLMLVSSYNGPMVVPKEQDVLTVYSAVSGYDPKTGANDNGAAITDVLDYWQTTGIAGHKILGWAAVNFQNILEVKQAIYIFGGVDLGVNLPNSAQSQFQANQPWDIVVPDGGIDGGHSVPNFGYGADGTNCITWAQRQPMSWAWFSKYCDEAYAVIDPAWLSAAQLTPSGFDLATLQQDLASLSTTSG